MKLSSKFYQFTNCLIAVFILALLIVSSCSKKSPSAPVQKEDPKPSINNWVKHPANPVLDLGNEGAWDSQGAGAGAVLYDGTTFRMWYIGVGHFTWETGYATSTDGVSWTRHSSPVLKVGQPGRWDEAVAAATTVLYHGSTYKMWYFGGREVRGSTWQIGYATSTDGLSWVKHSVPVLIGDDVGWENVQVWSPTVIFDEGIYKMWYSGKDNQINMRIGFATSPDGINWTKHPSNPVLDLGKTQSWESRGVINPVVLRGETGYQMWYTGYNGTNMRIGYATSEDGASWTKHGNPVIGTSLDNGGWESMWVELPRVVRDEKTLHLWYNGVNTERVRRTGYATSELN